MKIPAIVLPALGGLLVLGSIGGAPMAAQAQTISSLANAAAAIVGSLLTDANNRPYYVQNNQRIYVSQPVAQYYRTHNHGYYASHNKGNNGRHLGQLKHDNDDNNGRHLGEMKHDDQGNNGHDHGNH